MNRDQIIEAGARAWYAHLIGDLTGFAVPWEQLTPPNQDHYRRRAAFWHDAMEPLIRAQVAEEIERLTTLIEQKRQEIRYCHDDHLILTQRAEAAEARNAAALAYCAYAEQCGTKAAATLGGLIREVLGGETATTQTPAQPTCRQCGSPTVPGERGLCSDCWIRQGEDEMEMAHAPAVAAVEPRSGGERGNGRVADGDTAEGQEAS